MPRQRACPAALLAVVLFAAPALSQTQPPAAVNQQDEVVTVHLAPGQGSGEVLQILRSGDKFETNRYTGRVIELHNTTAYEILPHVRQAVGLEKGAVRGARTSPPDGSPSRHFLYVHTTAAQLPAIEEAIAVLDVPGLVNSQGSTRRAVRLKYRLASDLGHILESTRLSGQATLHADDLTNTLYYEDSEYVIDAVDEYVAFYDVPVPQIEFDVQIIELSESDNRRIGLDWDAWKRNVGGQFTLTGTNLQGAPDYTRLDSLLVLDANVLANFLNYTVQTGTGRLLRRSRLNASNLEPAVISEFKRIPHHDHVRTERNPAVVTEDGAGYTGTRTLAVAAPSHQRLADLSDEDEGIFIAIQPLIGTETVTASIEIAVNTFNALDRLGRPIVAEQRLSNRFTLENGEQILLGTIERETEVESRSGIPLLKDLPVAKHLFSVETTRAERSRLFLIATPKFSNVTYDALSLSELREKAPLRRTARPLDLESWDAPAPDFP